MSRAAFAPRNVVLSLPIALLCLATSVARVEATELYARVGATTQSPPIGWVQFCRTYAGECETQPMPPHDIVLSDEALSGLKQVNDWVNHKIKPMTDRDHYGMVQWWRYPDDGAGACHSYALLKRRLLMQAGWPRQALLMTIVHEANGRPRGPHRQDRPGRLHSRQSDRRYPVMVGDTLPLPQASIAGRPKPVGLAR